jgi:hypothetical protein
LQASPCRGFEARHLHQLLDLPPLRKKRGTRRLSVNATFMKRVPLPREQRRALRDRLRVLLAQQAWLEARVSWRADPTTVQKYLAPIQAEITAIEAQL